MIRVSKIVSKIAEKCFSQEEREILEYQAGQRQITIAAQLNYYYNKACWLGDEEALYDAICIRKAEKPELLLKIKALSERLALVTNPNYYDEVFIRLEGIQRSASSVSTRAEGGGIQSHNTGSTTADDKSDSWSIAGSKNAVGEMDEVNKLGDVWQDQTLNHGSIPQQIENQPPIIEPNIVKSGDLKENIKYRQFAAGNSAGEDVSKSHSTEVSSADETTTSHSSSVDVNVNKSFGDRNVGGKKFKTGEQLINMLKDELPSVRNKYWLMFHGLFIYERDY